jgi:hypothetical protein
MKRGSLVIFCLSIIVFVSCYSKTEPISGKNLIRSKDLVNILVDVHVAGGVLNLPATYKRFSFKDSISNYTDIIEKYGYTKEQLDNSMMYYFVKKPKQLQEIYDKVLSRLSEIETRIDSEFPKQPEPAKNLWEGNLTYSLPEEGAKEAVWFDIPVQDTGNYVLSFSVIVDPDDKSINPGLTVFFWKENGTPDGERDYWTKVSFTKDGVLHQYSQSKNLTDTTFTRIRGWLLDHEAQSGIWEKHMRAESILLFKEPGPNQVIE